MRLNRDSENVSDGSFGQAQRLHVFCEQPVVAQDGVFGGKSAKLFRSDRHFVHTVVFDNWKGGLSWAGLGNSQVLHREACGML